jgi:intein/homing endonuclease
MPAKWTTEEEEQKKKELKDLYIKQNKTIFEVGRALGIKYQTIYDRLKRLGIPTCPERKPKFRNFRTDIKIPNKYSEELAEFVGILLGDGHISPTQILITTSRNEEKYLRYLKGLMKNLFGVDPHTSKGKSSNQSRLNAIDTYIGSTKIVRYFLEMGLVKNKVESQVDVPQWIKKNKKYGKRFLRGFFDTDGSIYKLRFGVQVCYKNASAPLLNSTREILTSLDYAPSQISYRSLYLTRKEDLRRFFKEVKPANQKHINRAKLFKII